MFPQLVEKSPGKVLLGPIAQEVLQYVAEDGIIIDRLATEVPKSKGEWYQVSLEELIVGLLANKTMDDYFKFDSIPSGINANVPSLIDSETRYKAQQVPYGQPFSDLLSNRHGYVNFYP